MDALRPVAWGLVAAVGLSVTGIVADAADPETMTALVPFEFVANGKRMPPGIYTIEIGPGFTDPPAVLLQTRLSRDDERLFKRVIVSATPADEVDAQPQLVFQRVGELCSLERVCPPFRHCGRGPPSETGPDSPP